MSLENMNEKLMNYCKNVFIIKPMDKPTCNEAIQVKIQNTVFMMLLSEQVPLKETSLYECWQAMIS